MKEDQRINQMLEDVKEFDGEGFEKRVRAILGKGKSLGVGKGALLKYRKYLKAHLTLPCILTGIEDFRWEEMYVFGYGDQEEYEELKKTNASYTDQFEFIEFTDEFGGFDRGWMVKARRISDRKQFLLPLSELKAVDKKSANYQLLNDYAVWIVNYS